MPAYSEDDLKKMIGSELALSDTFQFTCQMCGGCCRKRSEPIVMTGLDVFRISQALSIKPDEAIKRFMEGYIGDQSHLPLFVLRERDDGSCSLLRKGRCTVQAKKPVVCAIHPLGRFFSFEDKKIHYFLYQGCTKGIKNGKVQTVEEWINSYNLHDIDAQSEAWATMLKGLTMAMMKVKPEHSPPFLYQILTIAMYSGYDISRDYITQVRENMKKLQATFDEVFHIKLKFEEI